MNIYKISVCLFISLFLFNSNIEAQKNGFNIKITIDKYPDSLLYLVNYYGKTNQIKDTAYIHNGNFSFEGKTPLEGGIYMCVTKDRKYFEMIVDKEQNFSLRTTNEDFVNSMKIKGSIDNEDFYSYLKFLSSKEIDKKSIEESYKDKTDSISKKELNGKLNLLNEDVLAYKLKIMGEKPNSFLTTILKASKEPEIPTILPKNDKGETDSAYIYQYYKAHFFDDFNFADERVLRTPIYATKLTKYFTKVLLQQADTLIKEADRIIAASKSNKETYKYCIWYFTYETETSQIMGLDAVFVHLVNTYYKTGEAYWVNETVLKNIIERADVLNKLLLGKPAPNMVMIDTNNNLASMLSIKSKYTILLFWDPDCGHCRQEIPLLRDWMKENKDKYGVEIFSICSDTNLIKWKTFINNFQIRDWINVNGTRSATENYHDLYDVISTPTIYLLDKDKKIIAKRLAYEQLVNFIKNDYNSKLIKEIK
ncbi:MAG: hypothetical protein AUJ98_02970 [Bacteroidetes bacterium CG2_30_33_31]|nr:MAG: hypothetical protein AUJ98_02970 [Bacteroidetes bacterium CG2_30_33_31]